VATLDVLSGGRAQLAVGLGALHPGWTAFEADEGRRVRAEKLDEGLAVYDGLMRGQPFTFEGRHYRCEPTEVLVPPPPVQQPRVPVGVVGAYPAETSIARAARWDGLLPAYVGDGPQTEHGPDALARVVERVRELREGAGLPWQGYEVIMEGFRRRPTPVPTMSARARKQAPRSGSSLTGPEATTPSTVTTPGSSPALRPHEPVPAEDLSGEIALSEPRHKGFVERQHAVVGREGSSPAPAGEADAKATSERSRSAARKPEQTAQGREAAQRDGVACA
jgi:Luciferase-like monooxygenase